MKIPAEVSTPSGTLAAPGSSTRSPSLALRRSWSPSAHRCSTHWKVNATGKQALNSWHGNRLDFTLMYITVLLLSFPQREVREEAAAVADVGELLLHPDQSVPYVSQMQAKPM